jgi:hypothetical protein
MTLHLQCDAAAGGQSSIVCQLYVGHEGEHAAVVRSNEHRLLRRWSTPLDAVEDEFTGSGASGLPWAPGHPTAGIEEPKPSLSVVATNPQVIATPKTADLHIA